MKGVLFLTLALVAGALAMPLCSQPECETLDGVSRNMTQIVIHLGNDTKDDIKITVPAHMTKDEANWYLMFGQTAINHAWMKHLITWKQRVDAIAQLKKALADLTDKDNNLKIVVEAFLDVFRTLNGPQADNKDITIDISNSSRIVIHVPDHISKQSAAIIFDMGKQMIEGEVEKGVITEERAQEILKELWKQLEEISQDANSVNAEIDIDVTEEMHIHLVLPDKLSKAQRDMVYSMGERMIGHAVEAGRATKEQGDAALKKLAEQLDKLVVDGEGELEGFEKLVNMEMVDDEAVLNEILANVFDDWWKQWMDALTKKGWVLTAKLLNKYKVKIEDMLKAILKDEAKQLIDLIGRIRDDIIKIIEGGHVTPTELNDEEIEALFNPFDDMWKKIIDFIKSKGHAGEIVAKLLNKYKGKIEDMLKKILKNEAKELIKLIDDIKNDIIKIIDGGHIDMDNVVLFNDEELENPFEDWWQKFLDWLNTKGKGGKIAAKMFVKYRGLVGDVFKKLIKAQVDELVKLITNVKNDIEAIIQGKHILPALRLLW